MSRAVSVVDRCGRASLVPCGAVVGGPPQGVEVGLFRPAGPPGRGRARGCRRGRPSDRSRRARSPGAARVKPDDVVRAPHALGQFGAFGDRVGEPRAARPARVDQQDAAPFGGGTEARYAGDGDARCAAVRVAPVQRHAQPWPHSTRSGAAAGPARSRGQAPKRSGAAGGGRRERGRPGAGRSVAAPGRTGSPVRRTAGVTGSRIRERGVGRPRYVVAMKMIIVNSMGPVKPDGPHRGAGAPSTTAATTHDNACEEGKPWLIC